MINGKIRSKQQIFGEDGIRFVEHSLPKEWVFREQYPDYGIDLDVELFDYNENGQCVSLGEHVFMQVKGTKNPKISSVKINDKNITVIKHSLEISELELVERMGSAFPVLLVIVDLFHKKAYQVCLNDYISKVLPKQNKNYREQKTVTIYVPLKNEITASDSASIRWYAMRNKIYALFLEMLSDVDDLEYSNSMRDDIKRFVEHYRSNDLLKRDKYWQTLGDISGLLDDLSKYNYVHPILLKSVNSSDYDGVYNNQDLYKSTIDLINNIIRNYVGCFETYCRTWYMPGAEFGICE